MIARLYGRLIQRQPPGLLIDVQGVGYEIQAPMSTFYRLPAVGENVTLLTHLVVRDDAHVLYGFATNAERELFRNLIRVSGVGPKMALAILSGIEPAEFVHCVQQRDAVLLTRLPGIGKKTAERLVVEMQDRLEGQEGIASLPAGENANPKQEAVSALVALGYKPADATRMVNAVNHDNVASEELIREALKAVAG